jgi:hypothetical protein
MPLIRLTPEQLRRLIAELAAAGYAPETVAKTMRWVRLTLNQAVKDRRIVTSPARDIQLPAPRRSDMRLLDPLRVNQPPPPCPIATSRSPSSPPTPDSAGVTSPAFPSPTSTCCADDSPSGLL